MAQYNRKNKSKDNNAKNLWAIIIIVLILGGVYLYNHWNVEDSGDQSPQDNVVIENSYDSEGNAYSDQTPTQGGESHPNSFYSHTSASNQKGKKSNNGPKDAKGNTIAPEQYWQVVMPSGIPSQMLQYTGMTISFNPELHIPNYVAWELTDQETRGRLERSDNFMPDPNCPESAQLYDYKRSGYDRGHMCPAADARWDEKFMQEVFYMTNMCPQDHELNKGEWNDLEIKCRQWARIDSAIIIITGPVLTDKLTKTIGPSKVAVPERFFKVILSPYANPPRAIGFVMANRNNPGGMERNPLSIDEVEAITSYDFFSILNDKTENEIESVNDFNTWSRLRRGR